MGDEGTDPRLELVDASGRTTGVATKSSVHRAPGRLHRAVSIMLLDAHGDLVVQRRALGKYHAAGLWANTACGHPAPGEDPEAAARRRLADELGLENQPPLEAAGTVTYRVLDRTSGLVEHEYDHLFVGVLDGTVRPDAAEVAEMGAMPLETFADEAVDDPGHAPWLRSVVRAAWPALIAQRERIRMAG